MVCLCEYHNSVTNLFSLAFQQLKSIGSGICYAYTDIFTTQLKCLAFLKLDIESFEDKRHDILT